MLTPKKISGSGAPIEVRIEKSRTVDICSFKSRQTEIVKRVDTRCLKDSPKNKDTADSQKESEEERIQKMAGRDLLLSLLSQPQNEGGDFFDQNQVQQCEDHCQRDQV